MWKIRSLDNYLSALRSKVSGIHINICYANILTSYLGFIAVETLETDDLGLFRTAKKGPKPKAGQKKQTRKEIQKLRYVFVDDSVHSKAYADYFNPDPDNQYRLLKFSDKVCFHILTLW